MEDIFVLAIHFTLFFQRVAILHALFFPCFTKISTKIVPEYYIIYTDKNEIENIWL